MRYAVLPCPCGEAWAAELRHATVRCPRCGQAAETATRKRLWQGDDAAQARQAAAALRASAAGADPTRLAAPARDVRHDSAADAAAAQAARYANASRRAEQVALWLTRLQGGATHGELLDALAKAGLDPGRAEREVVRMLACDILTEPRAGTYRVLDA